MTDWPPDADELRCLYWVEELSCTQIGDRYGVTKGAVNYWMSRYGIPSRSRSKAQELRERGYRTGEDHHNYIRDEDLLDDLIAGRISFGVWPSSYDYYQFGEYSVPTINRRFGTWDAAIERAKERFEETQEEWAKSELADDK